MTIFSWHVIHVLCDLLWTVSDTATAPPARHGSTFSQFRDDTEAIILCRSAKVEKFMNKLLIFRVTYYIIKLEAAGQSCARHSGNRRHPKRMHTQTHKERNDRYDPLEEQAPPTGRLHDADRAARTLRHRSAPPPRRRDRGAVRREPARGGAICVSWILTCSLGLCCPFIGGFIVLYLLWIIESILPVKSRNIWERLSLYH